MSGESELIEITIHSGILSVENGCVGPINQMFDLAKVLGTDVITGSYYGDDRIRVKSEDLPLVKKLLEDVKLLYRLPEDPFSVWRGVQTDAVRTRLARVNK